MFTKTPQRRFWRLHFHHMCDMNIEASTYYHGGMLVEFTRNIDRVTRTAHEMTEAQRDSYEALTENLAAFQRRNVGLAQEGLRFIKLQEENARAAQQWFATSVRLATVAAASSWNSVLVRPK